MVFHLTRSLVFSSFFSFILIVAVWFAANEFMVDSTHLNSEFFINKQTHAAVPYITTAVYAHSNKDAAHVNFF